MRIAQVAPPFESVPPARYGGTERVVSTLTEELVRRGHDVTLFASGDSRTSARLVATVGQALWHQTPRPKDFAPLGYHTRPSLGAHRGVRCGAQPPGLFRLSHGPRGRPAGADNVARAPRPALASAALPPLRRRAAGLDQRRPAPPGLGRKLVGDNLPRYRAGRVHAQSAHGWLCGLSRTHLA